MVNFKKLLRDDMKNIAILCSGGDDMPKKDELPHVFLDNIKIDVEHRKQRKK